MFDDQKGEGLGLVANRQPWAMPMVALRSHGSPESAVMEFGVSAVSAVPPTGMAQVATGETGEEIS